MTALILAGSGCPDQLPLPASTTSARGTAGDTAAAGRDVGVVSAPPPQLLTFTAYGTPAPQGSHRGFVVNGRAVITQDNKKTKPWRQTVKHAALEAMSEHDGFLFGSEPVDVDVCFVMPRPKHHYRTGRNAHLLRDGAPRFPAGKPDADKLCRSLLDALGEAGVWKDDSQVVHLDAWKVYVGHDGDPNEIPGAHINVMAAQ